MSDKELEPWEQPGAVRRDCEPHRSGLLLGLAIPAAIAGVLSFFCLPLYGSGAHELSAVRGPVGAWEVVVLLFVSLPWLIALPLGVLVWITAERDLVRMRAGLMDSRGLQRAENASHWARIGWTAGGLTFLLWVLLCGAVALVRWQ
jgi:hypothetical protein